MRKFRIPAVVFGGGMNGLAAVRNLGRYGIPTFCVVGTKDEVRHSRYCKRCYIIPHIQESIEVLRSFLGSVKSDLGEYPILFSTTDFYSLHLSFLMDHLEGNYHVPLPSYETVRTLVYKKEFYKSLFEHSLPCPATFIPESVEDVVKISKDVAYPLLVKPSMSQAFYRRFHSKGFKANTEKELLEYYLLARKHNLDVIFQEIIPSSNRDLCAENMYGIEGYLGKRHRAEAFFAYRRLRGWPPEFGVTSLRESIPIRRIQNQFNTTRDYLCSLGFHGLLEAEWKRDPRDGTLKLLEINARQSMQNSLPARCGVNLTMLAYLDSIGEMTTGLHDYETGVRWADIITDLQSIIATKTSIKDWLQSLRTVREWSFFAPDDVAPWFSNILENLKMAVGKMVKS